MKKFYEIDQNNSGGSHHVDDKLCHRLFIEAESEDEALRKAEHMGCYWNGVNDGIDCPCCGDRWYRSASEIDLERFKKDGYEAYIYRDRFKESNVPEEEKWKTKYGEFPVLEEPSWKKKYNMDVFGCKVYFDTIEQYAQFLANEYGWTTPDVRIFYADGAVKEIFTKK